MVHVMEVHVDGGGGRRICDIEGECGRGLL